MTSNSRLAVAILAGILAVLVAVPGAQAAQPAWHIFGATGPTNVPPTTSEVQEVGVDAGGGTFTLTFDSQTTPPIPFDADADQLEGALNSLGSVSGGGGSVVVRGGPGNPGAELPYFVSFGGELSGVDVAQMSADDSALTGGSETVTVGTKTEGAPVGSAEIAVIATNIGGAATSGTVTVTIGPLPPGITTSGPAGPSNTPGGWTCPGGAGATVVTCTGSTEIFLTEDGRTVLAGGRAAESLIVPIAVDRSLVAPLSSVPLSVSGGGAVHDATGEVPVRISLDPAPPGIQAFWAGAFDADGNIETRAGAHPLHALTGFFSNTVLSPSGQVVPAGDLRDIKVELPPGFVGNPLVTKRCAVLAPTGNPSELLCGKDSVVGSIQPLTSFFGRFFAPNPIFNNVPRDGYAAQFTSKIAEPLQTLVGSLRSDGDYGVTVHAPNIGNFYKVYGSVATFDGNPAGAMGKAFLTNPMSCSLGAPVVVAKSATWHQPTLFAEAFSQQPALTGCDQLDFNPAFEFQPAATAAASVTAATAELTVDQQGLLDPAKLASPHLKKSVVTLPEGMVLNPSAAEGLQACSTAQVGLRGTDFAAPNPIRFNLEPVACPDASKIGTVEVKTPLLEAPLDGVIYLAAQDDNPFKSLLAMYLVVENERFGITLKLPGEVKPNPVTGQLTAEFDNNPQTPFDSLKLSFRGGGPQSTLATPDVCGTYTTNGSFTPWSAPESGAPAQTQDSFEITTGADGSAACPRTKAERPFSLGFEAGSMHPVGGADSPFTLRVTRPDGNQELDRITASTPPGLLASLRGIGSCSEAQLAAAQAPGRAGKEEIAAPSCPASSQVGTTTIGAGVGSSPIYVKTGKVYLSGPYKGAPLSLAFVVPAVAGPFDLGVQVVRTALRVNPKTAQVTAESDSIPQILKGIPLLVRDVRVDLDRPGFVRNPTNCETMAVAGQVTGGSGAVSNVSSRFQVGNCANLGFKPALKLQLKGGTKRNKYQQVTAILEARPGDANIAGASVRFPRSIFLAQNHIRTVCTRVQFAADSCPPGSIYGEAEAETPLLDQPLKGPVYLRSSDNPLPDLVVALRGPDNQPIEVELAARTDSKNRGIRNTFDFVPDAPVSKFTLRMRGGNKSLLVSSRDLCLRKERAIVEMRGQNGMVRDFRPLVQVKCKKNKKHKKQKNQGRRGKGKKSR